MRISDWSSDVCSSDLLGGALLTEGGQRQECAVSLRHDAVRGQSRQIWRAVVKDVSTASLAARVEVARGAQKTDGEQSLRGLLLDRTATIDRKSTRLNSSH